MLIHASIVLEVEDENHDETVLEETLKDLLFDLDDYKLKKMKLITKSVLKLSQDNE